MGVTSDMKSANSNASIAMQQPSVAQQPPRGARAVREQDAIEPLRRHPGWVYPRTAPTVEDGRFLLIQGNQNPEQAIQALSDNIEKDGYAPLVSRKVPSTWPSVFACCLGGSATVDQFSLGFYHQQANQRVITRPGRYPTAGLFRSWDRHRTASLNETHICRGDFNYVRLNQNTVAVVQEPSGQTFLLEQGSAVSFGNYRVLDRVQPNNLTAGAQPGTCGEFRENSKERPVLGYVRKVVDGNNEVAATFLQVLPNCVAVVSRGGDNSGEMEVLGTGSWVFTEKNINLRGFFNKSIATHEMDEQTVRTADNIFVTISLYLRWCLTNPHTLASQTNYDSPVAALKDAIEANLNHVVGNLHFQSLQGMRDTSGNPINGAQQSKLLTDIQSACYAELKERAAKMGIDLLELEIRKNELKGDIVREMNNLALQNTKIANTAATIDRENANNMKAQENLFNVAQREAQTLKAQAQGEADRARMLAEGERDANVTRAEGAQRAQVLAAEGDRQARVAAAKAEQEVLNLQTQAEVSRIRALAEAKRLEAEQIAEGKMAIAKAEAFLAKSLGEVEDKLGAGALKLAGQRLQNENSNALSKTLNLAFLPSNGQNGDLHPVLDAVLGASVVGPELTKLAKTR